MTEQLESAPLDGITVLDLTRWLSGPYATMLLADAGATVIKVEPDGGESNRTRNPILKDDDEGTSSGYFARLNRRKRSVVANLRTQQGARKIRDLMCNADVLVENFRPGVLAKAGFTWEKIHAVNPRLVYCSISGFGSTASPYSHWPALNLIAESFGGLVNIDTNGAPIPYRAAIGDVFPGSQAVSGILMALLRRVSTGKGSFVDIAMYDSMISLNEQAISWASMTGQKFRGIANQNVAPYNIYPVADGFVAVGVATDEQWRKLCAILGNAELADDSRYATGELRLQNIDGIEEVLLPWMAEKTKFDVARSLVRAGVPSAPVFDELEVLDDPGAVARMMFEEVETEKGHKVRVPASPIKIYPDFVRRSPTVPRLGELDDTPEGEL